MVGGCISLYIIVTNVRQSAVVLRRLTHLFGIIAVQNQSKRLDVDGKPQCLQQFSFFVTNCQRRDVS